MTFPGMFGTPEEEKAFHEQRRGQAFLSACRLPLRWLASARKHERAANILYEIACAAQERNIQRLLSEAKSMPPGTSVSRSLEGQELQDSLDADLISEYLLLAGYALECVFKGALLAMLPDLVENGERLDRLVTTHDLCQLARDCGITLVEKESELLGLISRYVIWGKYAGPTHVRAMPSPTDTEDQRTKSLMITNPCHERREKRIVDDLLSRGMAVINAHWHV